MSSVLNSSTLLLDLINKNNASALSTIDVTMSPPVLKTGPGDTNTKVVITGTDVLVSGNADVSYRRLSLDELYWIPSPTLYTEDHSSSVEELTGQYVSQLESQLGVSIPSENYKIVDIVVYGSVFEPNAKVTVEFVGHYLLHGQFILDLQYAIQFVDMTKATLDSRVSFTCASKHAFFNVDGQIDLAAVDTYPLEYRNGIPMGRHEPEPQRTNLYYDTSMAGMRPARSALRTLDDALFVTPSTFTMVETVDNGAHYVYSGTPLAVNANDTYVTSGFVKQRDASRRWGFITYKHNIVSNDGVGRVAIFDINTGTYNAVGSIPPNSGLSSVAIGNGWRRISAYALYDKAVTNSTVTYVGSANGSGVVGNDNLSYPGDGVSGIHMACLQLERVGLNEANVTSSPMFSTGGYVTRANATVLIDTLGASQLHVDYTDGTSDTYDVSGQQHYQLPHAKRNWAERYIKYIRYVK